MSDWISVGEKLPPNNETWQEYLVAVYFPYNNKFVVTVARYDSRQKIWHLRSVWEEDAVVNALIPIHKVDERYENVITHWMQLPGLPSVLSRGENIR